MARKPVVLDGKSHLGLAEPPNRVSISPDASYNGKICEYDIDEGHLREVSFGPGRLANPDAKLLWISSLMGRKPP